MTYKRFQERADELEQLGAEMGKPGRHEFAEARYKVIVAELLILILHGIDLLRFILGFLVVLLLIRL